jgi:chromosome segregation ATPase
MERLRISEDALTITEQHDNVSKSANLNALQGKIDEITNANDLLQVERMKLKSEMEELVKSNADRDVEIDSLRKKVAELHELEIRLKSSITALESKINCHHDENGRLLQLIETQQSENIALHDKLSKLTEDHNFKIEKLESHKARITAALESHEKINKEKVELIEREMVGLRDENATLAKERDQLAVRLTELDDKLLMANDALQILTTDLASKEATEVAAEALREEVHSLHHQAQIDRATMDKLSHARENAEAEVKRLQNEIATFLGFDSYKDNQTAIEKRTMEAAESLQRSERNEIRAL